jgi:hypothetical protein
LGGKKIPSSQAPKIWGMNIKGSSQKLLISDSGKVEFCPLLEDSGLFKQKPKIKDVPFGNLLQFAIENGDLVRGFTPLKMVDLSSSLCKRLPEGNAPIFQTQQVI